MQEIRTGIKAGDIVKIIFMPDNRGLVLSISRVGIRLSFEGQGGDDKATFSEYHGKGGVYILMQIICTFSGLQARIKQESAESITYQMEEGSEIII